MTGPRALPGGPWFEQLRHGDVFDRAPAVTLTEGLAAVHQAVVGQRLALALDHGLSRRVTGADRPMAPPALVWDLAIGQSTVVTQRVVANLFYRGLAFEHIPQLGDTLHTTTEVVALRQNTVRSGRRPTGLAVLRMTTTDQENRVVLDFWRCAMLPLQDATAVTGYADDLSSIGDGRQAVLGAAVRHWQLEPLRARSAAPALEVGSSWDITEGDIVSCAPELARLTMNIAAVHHDSAASAEGRLVYGGHSVGLALSQAVRTVPEIVTVVGWHGCEHTGPVREGDTLSSTLTFERVDPVTQGRLAHLRSVVRARSHPEAEPRDVLDWRFVALVP